MIQVASFFVALRFMHGKEKLDLQPCAAEFLYKVNEWEGRRFGMDLTIEKVTQQHLPSFVFEDVENASSSSSSFHGRQQPNDHYSSRRSRSTNSGQASSSSGRERSGGGGGGNRRNSGSGGSSSSSSRSSGDGPQRGINNNKNFPPLPTKTLKSERSNESPSDSPNPSPLKRARRSPETV